jgi:F-type H+-transporting ATPase subunit epsilon
MADGNLFSINLVTPERILLTGQAAEVILRTGDGDTTFLAGHTPLVGTVEPGVVRVVRAEGEEVRIAAHGGFVQVEQNILADDETAGRSGSADGDTRVTLLLGVAELAEEIDTGRAQVALEAAEASVAGLGSSTGRSGATGEAEEPDIELVEAEAALLRAQVRLEAVDATSGTTA